MFLRSLVSTSLSSASRTALLGLVIPAVFVTATLAACSGAKERSGFDVTNGGSSGGTNSSGGFGTQDGGANIGCAPDKANYDIPGNNCDDDDDGTVDNPPTCDSGLSPSGSAEDFAKAIGICSKASEKGYGLVSATFTKGYNHPSGANDNQHGILPKFGDVLKPQEGGMLGVLSSGYAREYDGTSGSKNFVDTQDWSDQGSDFPGVAPPSFPKPAQDCPIDSKVYDLISVKLELKAPRNAKGIKFDFNFFTSEWPMWVCSQFNDSFIAFLTAKGFNNGLADNVSFDANNNPVSVNNNFFDRCTPNVPTGCASAFGGGGTGTSVCAGGPAELAGTGYDGPGPGCGQSSTNGGATGWLTTQAPVDPEETFTLEFMIWDTGDGSLDSSVLIDNFTWSENQVKAQTQRPN